MGEPAEDKLPLTAHLEDLKKRLVRSLIAIGIGFVACYYFKDGLFKIITKPLLDVMPKNSYMIYTSLPEAFFTYMKVAFFASLFVTAPFTFYQIWKFIAPGLYPREKRYVIPFVLTSSLLFVGGVAFAYFLALPPAFGFFVEFSSDSLRPMFTMREYLSFALKFLLAFGVSFQLPVFIFFMTKLGIVNSRLLVKQRRYAILIIFIAAAILTPSPDAFTQIIMAIPLMILYEISIFIAKFVEKKKKEAEAGEQAA
jgi:sec-independent protein translocase protein TatC